MAQQLFGTPYEFTMPTVTLRYRLPDEQHEFNAARLGNQMAAAIWDIDQRLRALLKHGSPTPEEERLAEEIRQMIRDECPDALDL